MKYLLLALLSYCLTNSQAQLIDKNATSETNALFSNLKEISSKGFLFGHHETEAYGVGWKGDENRSDVKDVCGSYPAVHGWDASNLHRQPNNIDNVPFDKMLTWIKDTYTRGGINTICWHLDNPTTKGNAWDKTSAVKDILPGGSLYTYYVDQLNQLAAYLDKCETASTKIPIIWRPFHEHNGNWFWWGKGNCTEDEFVKLWRFTVDYLRNEKKLHHLIYAFSPDRSRLSLESARESYLYGYPGDDYVDILGIDNYMDVGVNWNKKSPEEQRKDFIKSLTMLSALAKEKNKVAAITETGQEKITHQNWFTQVILNPIKENKDIQLAYIMVWRNDNPNHHYAPYPGHPSITDFMNFYNDEKTFLEKDIQNMYGSKLPITR